MASPSGITERVETCFCCCRISVSQLRREHFLQVCLIDLWRYCATLPWKPNMWRRLLISHFILSRWTTKGAISSTWPCRTPTLKVSCSSSASRPTSIPGFRMQPNSPPSTWLSRPDPRSLSATWCALRFPVVTGHPQARQEYFLLENGMQLVIFSSLLFFFCLQLLAGAKVNELTKHRQTALHLAAQQDLATICSVLLENGVDFAAEDENGNNGNF